MNIPIDELDLVGSVLKVTASESLDVSKDLLIEETISLSKLLEHNKESHSVKKPLENSEKENN